MLKSKEFLGTGWRVQRSDCPKNNEIEIQILPSHNKV